MRELSPLLPEGPALDLACGRGGNTLFLADQGRAVTAIDWSEAALEILEREASRKSLAIQRENAPQSRTVIPGIATVRADLTSCDLPNGSFAVVVCARYLDRHLWKQIPRALQPGGMVLIETFPIAQLQFNEGPRNPAFLLEPAELRTVFPQLRTVFYRELRAGQGIATLLAAKPG